MAKFSGGVGHGLQGAAQVLGEDGEAHHREQQHDQGHKHKYLGHLGQDLARALHRLRCNYQTAYAAVGHGADPGHQVAVFLVYIGQDPGAGVFSMEEHLLHVIRVQVQADVPAPELLGQEQVMTCPWVSHTRISVWENWEAKDRVL